MKFPLSLLFLVTITVLRGQTITVGNDTTICSGTNAILNAAVTSGSYGTSSYTFQIIPYAPEPFSGGNQIDPEFQGCTAGGNDDCWAGPYGIGFSFCFFNQYYTEFWVGSNGWIGFSNPAGLSWTTFTSVAIPSTAITTPKNCIFAPWEDWYPGALGGNNVYYYLTGTAPFRKLVVYWLDCPMYGCTGGANPPLGKFQIVINEQSSIVENHIANKPICSNHTATQGVHNSTGTVAFTATGRNSTVWSASNESTRFVPSGIKWYAGGYPGGTIVGYGPSLTIAPAVTTLYTAVVETCGGGIATDSLVVTVLNPAFSYLQNNYCQNDPDPVPVITQPGGIFSALPAGMVIDPVTGVIDLSACSQGIYLVVYTLQGICPDSNIITVTGSPLPPGGVTTVPRCGPGTVALTATVNLPGATVNWYDAPVGGMLLASSKLVFITPVLTTTTTYYAQAVNGSCLSIGRTPFTAVINPVPLLTNFPTDSSLCSGQTTSISLFASVPFSGFSWMVKPGNCTPNIVACPSPGSGNLISDLLALTNTTQGTVTYSIIPFTASCTGDTASYTVTVKPFPAAAGPVTGPSPVCQLAVSSYSVNPVANASSYGWSVVPGTAGVITGTGATASMSWSGSYSGTGTIYVKGVNSCGEGPLSPGFDVTVNPNPVVSYSFCTDSVTTTNARPFLLKGGIPAGGSWSGPGVNNPSPGYFNPSAAGPGPKTVQYSYTNIYGCSRSRTRNMNVLAPPAFSCGNNLTDIRDGKSYPTVKIGSQCWMAASLNFGSQVSGIQCQRENCIPEKYCFSDFPSNCSAYGALYQWDEAMQYENTAGSKGLCPPEWHIPTETEWTALFVPFNGTGFAGDALKFTGFSGFNALLAGADLQATGWYFSNFAGFFWSSEKIGPYKAWAHGMNSYDPSVSWYPASRTNAFYVRCIKD